MVVLEIHQSYGELTSELRSGQPPLFGQFRLYLRGMYSFCIQDALCRHVQRLPRWSVQFYMQWIKEEDGLMIHWRKKSLLSYPIPLNYRNSIKPSWHLNKVSSVMVNPLWNLSKVENKSVRRITITICRLSLLWSSGWILLPCHSKGKIQYSWLTDRVRVSVQNEEDLSYYLWDDKAHNGFKVRRVTDRLVISEYWQVR